MASKAENNIVTLSINTTKNYEKFQLMQKIVRLQFFTIFSTGFQKIANLAIFAIFWQTHEKSQFLQLRANLDISVIL